MDRVNHFSIMNSPGRIPFVGCRILAKHVKVMSRAPDRIRQMTEGNKNCAKYTKHTAKWNEKAYSLSTTDWSRMIGCPISQVERGLKNHGSIQQYIDLCHDKTQKIAKLSNFFLYRRVC